MNTRPWAGVKTVDVLENCFTLSGVRHVYNLLLQNVYTWVSKYSEQIEWWTKTSTALILFSFLYSIPVLTLQEGILIAITGLTLTSGFAVVFCLCKKILTTNFTQLLKNTSAKIQSATSSSNTLRSKST